MAGTTANPRPGHLIRGSREWLDWLDSLSSKVRLSRSAAIDQALVRFAAIVEHDPPPPRTTKKGQSS